MVNDIALQDPDREKTTIIFFDAVDPKSSNDKFPQLLNLHYEVEVNLINPPADPLTFQMEIKLPVAVKPSQVPQIVSGAWNRVIAI